MGLKTKEERAAYARAWRAANTERAREIDMKKRARQTPGAAAERTRKWRAANPEKAKETARAGFKKYYAVNKERLAASQRAHRAKHIERYRAYNAKWHRENRANNPLKVRAMHLKSMYGLTLEGYANMLSRQGGTCAACPRSPDQEKHGVLHIDHDHHTGVVRGLLCSNCNTALGLVNDDPVRLHRYLISRVLADP